MNLNLLFRSGYLLIAIYAILPHLASAQFQRQYGTNLDETFTKVIPSGTNYYVLGTGEITNGQQPRATVTRLNAAGQLQWTLSLNVSSQWNDAVLTPNGDLLVVGRSLPDDNTSRAIMGRVAVNGTFSWLRSYDQPNRDGFTRIVRNPAPDNAAFPYYVLGHQLQALPATDDVFLMNINENGGINWKKLYLSTADDEFTNVLLAMPNGDLILGGHRDGEGLIMRADKTGALFNGATPDSPFTFVDIASAGGAGFYAVGYSFQQEKVHLIKFDVDLINQWDVTINSLTEARQVFVAAGGIYVSARKGFKEAASRITETGGDPTLEWSKTLDNGVLSQTNSHLSFIAPGQLVYVDGRTIETGGFGQNCAFMSVSGLDLATCMTENEDGVTLTSVSSLFNGPLLPDIQFYEIPDATNLTGAQRTWQQGEACQASCLADFSFQFPNCDPTVSFTNLSSGTGTLSYFWDFGYSVSGIPITSVATNPIVTFPAQCASYNVCLTVTGAGCTDVICKTVTIKYPQTPVLTCPSNITVACNSNLSPNVTGLATLTEPCSAANASITYSDVTSGSMPCNGTVLRTFTATDECNVTRTCMQTILVHDNVPPVAVCAPGQGYDLMPGCTLAITPAMINGGSMDNCQIQSIVVNPSSVQGCGIFPVTLKVTDLCGNMSTCNTEIQTIEGDPPMIMCPPNITLACDDDFSPTITGMATASDMCDPNPTITYNDVITGTMPCNGFIIRTWTAMDNCGNESSCIQQINVMDNIPPVAGCVSNLTVTLDALCTASVTPADINDGSYDNCQVQSGSVSPSTFTQCGTYQVTLTVLDKCNNSGSCTTSVQVKEHVAPMIVCPQNIQLACGTNTSPSITGTATATDNCDPTPTISFSDAVTGTLPCNAVIMRTWTATDNCTNTASCVQTITVFDNIPPTISCPQDATISAPPPNCNVAVANIPYFGASDNCGLPTVTYTISGATNVSGTGDASGTIFNLGTSTVTYTATDQCNNATSCSFDITIQCGTAICCPEFSLVHLDTIMPCDDACNRDSSVHFPSGVSIGRSIACKNSVQTYYVVPNLPGFNYSWTITGGTPASFTGNPAVITWGNSDEGTIVVIITDATGTCRDTIMQELCLLDSPTAGFTIAPGAILCTNQPVSFTNTSVGATTYHWDFGDNTSSTLKNPPPHSYPSTGTYTVVLTVSNQVNLNPDIPPCGCIDTAMVVITVMAGTGPTITPSCKKMLCPGDTSSYCVTPACAPFNWTVNGGTITANNGSCITVQWDVNPPATFPASVSVTTGCSSACGSSATLNVPVLWNNLPITGPDPVCVGDVETYSLPIMPGTFYMWTVSSGGVILGPTKNTPTIAVRWIGPVGTQTISCIYNNPYSGCNGSSTRTIHIRDQFDIVGTNSICKGFTGSYNVTTGISPANWTISPATGYTFTGPTTNVFGISVNWTTPGNYTVTATPTNPALFCNPSAVIQVVVKPAPVVNINGAAVICPNELINYSATSNLAGGNFSWTLTGTGGTVSPFGPNNSNAAVNFTGSGPWILTAIQTVNGCSGITTLSITAEPPPTLSSTSITACIGGQITVSVATGNGPFTWSSTPAASLISAQGANSATYEIHGSGTIMVSNCGGTASTNVTKTTPQSIQIQQTGTLCAGNAQLVAPTGGVTYTWLGGGTPVPPNFLDVTKPGIYSVQVTYPDGCISVASFTVQPEVVPTVTISTSDPLAWCIPATPSVDLHAFTQTGCTYQWYSVGPIPGATGPIYTATAPGSYYVVVTCGNCVATSNIITVYQLPCNPPPGSCTGVPNPLGPITVSVPQGNPAAQCNPKEFSVSVTGCPGGVVTWSFGDGSPLVTGNPVIHTFTKPGAYAVSASITCSNCTFGVHTSVNIPVIADFNYHVVCGANGSYTVTFNNTSQILGGWTFTPSTDVVWSSNCGSPSGGSGNTFILNTTPNCQPTVTMDITVMDSANPPNTCTDRKTFTLNLPTAPLSITGPSTVCKNQTYQFFSSMTGSNVLQYQWMVNGTPVSQVNPLSYAFDGNPINPIIDLTVIDVFGCTYTASKTLMVVMPNTLSINPVKICPDCTPPATLTATPTTGFTNYQWYYNGNAISGATASTYQLCQPYTVGNYYVTAEDTQHNNCLVTSNTVQVTYHPKPDAAILSQTIICVPATGPYNIPLSNASGSNSNYSYNWTATGPGAVTFTPNNSQYSTNASVTALGTYEFILTVTDNTTGCMARDTFCVYLYPDPTVNVTGPTGSLCAGMPYTFTASATPPGNYAYQWNNGVLGPVMTTSQAGVYSVIATNLESGCSDSGQTGLITPSPSTILFPCGCDTICDRDTIIPPLALVGGGWPNFNSGYSIQWFLNGDYSAPFYTGPFLSLGGNLAPPLVYGVNNISIVVTYQGCSDTSEVYNLFIKKCCECSSNLTLSYGGMEYPVFCNPHVGFIPSLSCPNDDVIISGFFGFEDPTTGEPCEETEVIWELVKPNLSTEGGITTNFTNFIFLKDSVSAPGLYCLNLTTISPDGLDTCFCKVTWIQEPCECCTTLEDFCNRVENNVTLSVDNNLCKVTVSVDNLPPCDAIEWINWGDLNQDPGPPIGGMAMHTYTGPGTYTICYLAVERDTNGIICFEKVICDTITVECPGCYCGTFSDLVFLPFTRNIQITPVFCDSMEVNLPCPTPGNSFNLSGNFQCAGPNCLPSAQITWELYRLPNTTTPVASNSTTANPYFGINILPAWYAIPGTYELHLVGHCGLQECPCVVKFTVNCPDPCPCDVTQFAKDVANGFAVASSGVSCKACFTPITLNDCDMVTWHVGNTNNPPIGMSIGKQTFCHTFPNGGTYTVFMVVTRKKSDGTICEMGVKSQTVTVLCIPASICSESIFDNPSFGINAVGGSLGQMGMGASANWTAAAGEPIVLEGFTGLDAWSISLSGNYDAADALMPSAPVCLDNTEGMITLRAKDMSGGGRSRPCDRMVVALDNDWLLDNTFILAQLTLSELDWGEWYDIQIPYNLADWPGLESCGNDLQGARIQPIVYTTNVLIDAQGGADTRSTVQVDYFCMDGQLITGTKNPDKTPALRLYPNPTTGALTLDWAGAEVREGAIQLVGPLGQTLRIWTIPDGAERLDISLDEMPGGMYYVKLLAGGRLAAVRKVVKR